jgi:RND family efflux transporter MFP subunit
MIIYCHFFRRPLVAVLLWLLPSAMAATNGTAPISAEALVSPGREVELATAGEGLIMDVPAEEGTALAKGDPVVVLTSDEEEIRLAQAEMVAEQLEKDMEAARRLYEQKAASLDDLNRARLSFGQAVAERDLHRIRLRERSVASPFDGIVLRVLKEPGESVRRLEAVARMVSIEEKRLTAYLEPVHFGVVAAGDEVVALSPTGSRCAGRIDAVDPVLDAGGGAFRVTALVEDADNLLPAGSRVAIEIKAGR